MTDEERTGVIGSVANAIDFDRDVRNRASCANVKEIRATKEEERDEFVVTYRKRLYDIQEFLPYHPGGKKVFKHLKNRSLDRALEENPHSKAAFHLFEDFTLNNQEKYQEYEDLLDWDAPILLQVGTLGDRYWEWVNLPVNRQIRLFQSNLLESLSITPWYLIPMVWIPLCVYFLYSGWMANAANSNENILSEALICYVSGIFMWTILEYVLHRKLFHFKPPATSKLLIMLHFILHGVHHKAPFDNRRLVFPPIAGLLMAKLIVYIYGQLFPGNVVHFIAAGTTTGYIFYDLTHYYLHHGAPNIGSYFYQLKRHHNYHHFVHHELGFGICSKLWDRVFRTNICLRQLAKPIEW